MRAIEKSTQKRTLEKVDPIVKTPVFLGLTADREILYSRADRWVDIIFNEQFFEEVKGILKQFPKSHRLTGLVYKSAIQYLAGALPLEEAKQRVKFDTHAYIRRQQTWFKRNASISWLNIDAKNFDSTAISIVQSELHG
jgi:tRNA dimethylallyltransferase